MSNARYACVGRYDSISADAGDLLSRLKSDGQLARFWQKRGGAISAISRSA